MRYIIAALFSIIATVAQAQSPTRLCFSLQNGGTSNCVNVDNGNPLPVNVISGGGLSITDQATWTQGVSFFTPSGGIFNDTATLSSGQEGTFRLTSKRAQIIDTDTSGNALYSAITAPIPPGNAANGGASGNIGAVAQFGSPWIVGVQYGATALVADPCQSNAATFTPISISASGTTRIITNAGGKKIYLCHIHVVTTAGDNVALVEGTTSCSSPTGMAGGNTAANGWNFAINSGIALGNGASAIAATATAGDDVCLIQSSAVQLSGSVKSVQQ